MAIEPERLLARLSEDISEALGDDLRGLYVYGSWVTGDFHARRSDLDLLAVLAVDPTDGTVATLSKMHKQVTEDHPEWMDRIEVEYLSTAALRNFRTNPHPMVRISPGEPLHVVTADRHYLLNWYVAREQGGVLRGPPPRELIPEISTADFYDVVREHAMQWPRWVRAVDTPDSHAYAVLTVCRALFSITEGGQVSKLEAAAYGAALLPQWADLITWARQWWYETGADVSHNGALDIARFVDDVTTRIVNTPAPSTAVRWTRMSDSKSPAGPSS